MKAGPPSAVAPLVALLLLVRPPCLRAQQADPDWNRLRGKISAGDTVHVLTDGAGHHRGTMELVSESALVLSENGRQTALERRHVAQVVRDGDSLKNGAVIGGLVGGAGSAAFGGYVLALCANEGGINCPKLKVVSIAGPLAIGIGIGVVVDAIRQGSTTLYRRRSSVRVVPVLGSKRGGLGVQMAWR